MIYFGEAQITSPINEFLKQANLSLINKFIPFDASEQGEPISGLYVAEVQDNNICMWMALHIFFNSFLTYFQHFIFYLSIY